MEKVRKSTDGTKNSQKLTGINTDKSSSQDMDFGSSTYEDFSKHLIFDGN